MAAINFYQEFERLEEPGQLVMRSILKADIFDITLFAYSSPAEVALHDCGESEFFYVFKGEVEMQVGIKLTLLREGEGILVKAGEKHKHSATDRAWMMVISKHPHKHTFYEKIAAPKVK